MNLRFTKNALSLVEFFKNFHWSFIHACLEYCSSHFVDDEWASCSNLEEHISNSKFRSLLHRNLNLVVADLILSRTKKAS